MYIKFLGLLAFAAMALCTSNAEAQQFTFGKYGRNGGITVSFGQGGTFIDAYGGRGFRYNNFGGVGNFGGYGYAPVNRGFYGYGVQPFQYNGRTFIGDPYRNPPQWNPVQSGNWNARRWGW